MVIGAIPYVNFCLILISEKFGIEKIFNFTGKFKDVLPEYPSTRHLPWKPNNKGDKIATEKEVAVIFESNNVYVQEKIDGANCGMTYLNGHPVLRNRTKILRKGQQLKNPSLSQFASAWNWMHKNENLFTNLAQWGPYSVYGEWMIQQHGMLYNELPDWFIAYDIYDYEKLHYLDPKKSCDILLTCGFKFISNLLVGKLENYETLEQLANATSSFTNSQREGIIIKISDGEFITNKFKMVRQGFNQGCLLGKEIKKNLLINF